MCAHASELDGVRLIVFERVCARKHLRERVCLKEYERMSTSTCAL